MDPPKIIFWTAQARVPVFHDIRRYLTDNILTPLFWRFHNQIFLNNCGFYGRQKVLLSVTALGTRRSFTGFAGKLPSSCYIVFAELIYDVISSSSCVTAAYFLSLCFCWCCIGEGVGWLLKKDRPVCQSRRGQHFVATRVKRTRPKGSWVAQLNNQLAGVICWIIWGCWFGFAFEGLRDAPQCGRLARLNYLWAIKLNCFISLYCWSWDLLVTIAVCCIDIWRHRLKQLRDCNRCITTNCVLLAAITTWVHMNLRYSRAP